MLRTPYFCALDGLSSTLSLAILRSSLFSFAMSSSNGAIILQGPHHSAQKSTNTGVADLITSDSNDLSLTTTGFATRSSDNRPDQTDVQVFRKHCSTIGFGDKAASVRARSDSSRTAARRSASTDPR